MISISFDYNL